jgi:hypothetical protein
MRIVQVEKEAAMAEQERAERHARIDRDSAALREFRQRARRMKPTKMHRPVLWECMLGAVYAADVAGDARYYDYDYTAAVARIGMVADVRVHRADRAMTVRSDDGAEYYIRKGQWVWWATLPSCCRVAVNLGGTKCPVCMRELRRTS